MPVDPAALGAFLSGVGAVISAIISLRIARKRAEKDCERRMKEMHDALVEGIELGRKDNE